MNAKTTALLMVVIMIATASAALISDDSDAYNGDQLTKDVYVKVGESTDVMLKFSEYSDSYYTYTSSWTVNGESIVANGTSTESIGTDLATVSISTIGTGNYKVTITGGNNAGDATATIVYTLTTTINGSSESLTDTLTYNLNVHVIANILPADFGVSMTFAESITAQKIGGGSLSSDYKYYAVDLPAGVQMAPDGTISGTPTSSDMSDDEEYTITVVATHSASDLSFIKKYTVTVTKMNDFTFSVRGNDVKEVVENDRYAVYQGGSVTLTTTVNGYADNVDNVYVIKKNDGNIIQSTVDGTTGEYTIPTLGSGEYSVVMVNDDIVKSFTLVVVAQLEDVHTGIGFTPAVSPSS